MFVDNGKSQFVIGDTSSFMVVFAFFHVSFGTGIFLYLDLLKVVGKIKRKSPKWWFLGDESHGRIRKKSS